MSMNRNLVSITFAEQRVANILAAITTLETELADLVSIPAEQRRELFKMGDKSEVFCRETLGVLADNPKLVPESLGLPEAQADLAALDALRRAQCDQAATGSAAVALAARTKRADRSRRLPSRPWCLPDTLSRP